MPGDAPEVKLCPGGQGVELQMGGADQWGEIAILHASDAQVSDRFGGSVASAEQSLSSSR